MATSAFLVRLMAFTPLSRSIRVGAEDVEALQFASELRAATLEGRLLAVWTHPANELAGIARVGRNGARRVLPQAALARALGLIKGSSDYLFLWASGSAAVEFKSRTGSLSPEQRDWRDWCQACGVPFHHVRSAAEGLDVLAELGVYRRST